MPKQPDALSLYRAKRRTEATPEPAGAVGAEEGRLFVVHKHAATRTHWDLRLELQGVLMSWAVPKGPSRDPADKRLAVHVEDHPLEYGDFEGIIPEGNYGAGAVIVWDRGEWVPLEDPTEGLKKGKLLFELKGYKLRGRWTLVKIKKAEKEWLLIKERDGFVETGTGSAFPEASVLSGLTVEELGEGTDRVERLSKRLAGSGAKQRAVDPRKIGLMLAETREKPFSKPGWVFEIKYDGYRILAARRKGETLLLTRNGNDVTATFPEIARAVAALPYDELILDGEVVVHDEKGLPSFQRLQKRGRLTRPIEIRHAAVELPATLYVFDVLAAEGYDLRGLPLTERKAFLPDLLPAAGALKHSDHLEEQGEAFYEQVAQLGLEGIVAKRADSKYRGERSPDWIKIRVDRTDDFVVVGYTAPKRGRKGFGALHVAAYDGEALVYCGRVGSGFDTRQLDEVRETLEAHRRDTPPCARAPADPESTWVEPELVVEVRYKEVTEEGLLRQPVFLRFRDDKPPTDCVLPAGRVADRELAEAELAAASPAHRSPLTVHFSNLDKVFFPELGLTKGDLIEYYRDISPWLLPYLEDRPLVMTRFPDGIHGKSFFQKDAPGFAPEWLRTETMWSEDTQRELSYFICDTLEQLLYVINLGTIPLHVWSSRVGSLERPDWCILDLDPKEAPFKHVITIAKELKKVCDEIALPCFAKTSGSSGVHVLVPLARQCTHEQSRTLAELLARVMVTRLPDIATVVRSPARRQGKVYVDFLQNGHGRLLVAPFAARPVPAASVSMPLKWTEVNARLRIDKYTMQNAVKRMEKLGDDPLAPVLTLAPDLGAALAALGGLMDAGT